MNQRANRKKVMKTEEKMQLLQSELSSGERTLDSHIYMVIVIVYFLLRTEICAISKVFDANNSECFCNSF